MREKLKDYVNSLFRGAPDTQRNRELREEILQNTLDRFDDLVAQGCTEEEAYSQAVASIGDVRQLWEAGPERPRRRHTGWIVFGCVAAAAVIALMVGLGVYFRRPSPPHYEPEHTASLGEGIGEIVDWAMDLTNDVVDHAVEHGGVTSSFSYDHAEQYSAGPVALSGKDVRDLSLNWLSGTVTVEVYDGDVISVSETEQSDEDLRLHWRLDGQKLIIQPFSSGIHANMPSKDLLVQVPAALASGLKSLKVDTTSADASVSGLTLEELCFDSVSGSLTAQAFCRKLEVDTTSGGMEFTGTASEANLDTVSGNFVLTLSETPDECSFDSTSGCVTLALPADRSFRAELETVSGDLRCAYDTQAPDRDTWVYTGTGRQSEAELEFDTVSGSVDIRKAS